MRNPLAVVCITILFVLGHFSLHAKTIKGKDLVQERRAAGKKFEDTELFDLAIENKSLEGQYDKTLSNYEIFTLDIEKLQELAFDGAEQITLSLPSESKNTMKLELVKVNILGANFQVMESATGKATTYTPGAYYRGIIEGKSNSFAAFSFFEDEVMGLISLEEENLVIGKLKGDNPALEHVVYKDAQVFKNQDWACETPDDGPDYTADQLETNVEFRSADPCVGIYFEVDHDIFLNKGGITPTGNYITGIFNQVATLYANENIDLNISELLIWNTPSPYGGTSSSALLTQFQNYRTNFNGDLAQLVSYQASGGIAVLSGLCHPVTYARMSFASIGSTYNTVPTYSFTVEVVAHELGHQLGSRHTHACAWNGNNTAIDGCAGFTEGSCGLPSLPSNGGTIMSYCHITGVGINFNNGFGTQPGNVMRNFIANANCLQPCVSPDDNGDNDNDPDPEEDPTSCENNLLTLRLVLDDYGPETTWWIRDSEGETLFSGGPYEKGAAGTEYIYTFCMPDDCYTFKILDSYGDGICCEYGNGGYALSNEEGTVLASGGEFASESEHVVCLPDGEEEDNCTAINFNETGVDSYGYNQDFGTYEILDDGVTLKIQNNAWKSIPLDYTITPNTVLVFDFGSTQEGEIHAIGFDNNEFVSFTRTFKLFGTQNWGFSNYDDYPGNGEWMSFTIPIGQAYTGTYDRLFFVADHDNSPQNGNSYFRNIRIYEGTDCNTFVPNVNVLRDANSEGEVQFKVYPNPAQDFINLTLRDLPDDKAWIKIVNVAGQIVQEFTRDLNEGFHEEVLDISTLAEGNYMLKVYTISEDFIKQFNITRKKK